MRSELETCWTLIRGAARGLSTDREEFARRYLPTVRSYLEARWRSNTLTSEIDDVVQEVFIACFRDGGALSKVDAENESGFRALLYSVTRNVALHTERTRARRLKRVQEGQLDAEISPSDEATLSRVFDRAFAQAVMREARSVMATNASEKGPDAVRRVELLRLRFEDGLPIRKIAAEWDADATQLHREYAKASREFKAALGQVVTETERCPPSRLDAECDRLLKLLRG